MDEDECCSDDIPDGYPDLKPPCTEDTCTGFFSSLRDSNGRLAWNVRLRGGNRTKVVGDDCDTCEDVDDCGVLVCVEDADGNFQGIDVDIFGDPAVLEDFDCLDEDGNSLYENPLRKIKSLDGSCSLGVLPFPIQDTICNEELGCGGIGPEGDADSVLTNCAKQVCTTIENRSCYPMIVVPKVTIREAQTGPGTSYEVQANLNGNFDSKAKVFSGGGASCSVRHVPGDDIGHDVDCGDAQSTYHTGTIEWPPQEIAAGESFTFCIEPSIRYENDVSDVFDYNFGDVRVCLDGRSKVNAETIAALSGGDS